MTTPRRERLVGSPQRRLTARVLVALGLLVLIGIAGHLVVHVALTERLQALDVATTLERQRSAAQRLVAAALAMSAADTPAERAASRGVLSRAVVDADAAPLLPRRPVSGGRVSQGASRLQQRTVASEQAFVALRDTGRALEQAFDGDDEPLRRDLMAAGEAYLAPAASVGDRPTQEAADVERLLVIQRALLVTMIASAVLAALLLLRPAVRRLAQDIAALEAAQEELRWAEAKYRSIFDNAVEGIFQTSPDGRYISGNPALARIYGYASVAELQAAVTDIGGQLYVEPGRRDEFARLLRTDDVVSGFESQVYRRDGSIIWILENARAVRDPDGTLLYYEGNAQDVTARNTAAQELQRHRDHLEELVAERTTELRLLDHAVGSTAEGITIVDTRQPGQPVVYVNSGFTRITGWAAEDVVGRNCRFLQGPETDPLVVEEIRRSLAEERQCTVEILNYRKDGTPFWNLLSLTPVPDDRGVVTNFIGVQSDITQRKEVERLKTELVATVSHELRTPLASMRGFTELLLNREFPPERQREFLRIVRDESVRLTNLVNDFLDLQRMEAGRETYDLRPLPLAPLLREVVALFAAGTAHTIRLAESAALPAVLADGDRIRQVLTNLLSNAVKFSPEGGTITLDARADGHVVTIRVRDEGIGMTPESVERLFTKFFRVDNAATRRIGGTGLGLALVKQIVEAHGGRVEVTSRLGDGSTFAVTLPVAAAVRAA